MGKGSLRVRYAGRVYQPNPPRYLQGYMEIRSKKEYSERQLTITVLNSETRKPEENARVVMVSPTRTVKGEPYVLLDRKMGKSGKFVIAVASLTFTS